GGALSHACLPAAARRSSMPRRTAGGRSNRPRTRAGRQSWASAKTPGVLLPRWIRRGQTARRMNQAAKSRRAGGLRSMTAGAWALGLVSLLMDVSSEMIHALLPVFLVGTLGASYTFVGVMEGVAEAIASITKIFSGAVSDRLGRRKPLAVLGYGLAAVTKPMFALAPAAGWVLAARFIDRVGKGIRGAPRDALVAKLVPAETRGAAYGLRQALDTVGAFAGPLLAVVLMAATGDALRTVFWIAVVPAVLSVAV